MGMKRLTPALFVAAVLRTMTLDGQSFTQTIGGPAAQDGIGTMAVGAAYKLGIRDFDPTAARYSGQVYSMNGTGGFLSAYVLDQENATFLQDLIIAPDGSAFLVGSVMPSTAPDHDGLLVKLNASGGAEWTTRPEVPGSQQYLGAVALPDGGAVVCGVSNEGGGHEVLIVRFDAAGSLIWSHVEPSFTDAEAHSIALEGSTLMITGRQASFGNDNDVLCMRMDLAGMVSWSTSLGGANNDEARAIISAGEGTFIMAGWTNSFGTYDLTSQRIPAHTYLIAVDQEGDTLWTRVIGDTLHDRHAYAMEKAFNGDLLITGERSTSALSDALIQRLNPSGQPIWERALDTGKEERLVHLLPLEDGLIGTGWSFGPYGRQVLFIRRNADGF